jgi:hypothetical protein
VKDTYQLTYDDGNLPTHYGFKLDHVARNLDGLRRALEEPHEKLLASRAKAAIGKVQDALKSRHADGVCGSRATGSTRATSRST